MGVKVLYQVSEKCKMEQDVPDVKAGFRFMSYLESIFNPHTCGHCEYDGKGPEGPFQPIHKQSKEGHDFYSMKCPACNYELKFGQTKVGNRLWGKEWEEPWQGGNAKKSEDKEKPAERETAEATTSGDAW